MLVKIFGSSIVRDLYKAVGKQQQGLLPDFGLGAHHYVDFSWIAGGTAGDFIEDNSLYNAFGNFQYDVVVIIAGGNDLSWTSGAQAGADYVNLVKKIFSRGYAARIICCSVPPRSRPRNISQEEYTRRATEFNDFLAAELQSIYGAKFWRHKGIWNANEVFVLGNGKEVHLPLVLLKDGVHFNDEGMHRLHKSVGGAIRHAMNMV